MLSFQDGLVVEVWADIAAPPGRVWEVITDINLSSRFSSEFVGAEWIDDGPALGAAFKGKNQRGHHGWETTSWVTSYEPPRAFGWSVGDRDSPGATWTFTMKAQGAGTRLTYHRLLGPGSSGITARIARDPEREHEILTGRNEEHRLSMQAVVEGVKAMLEDK